MDQKDKNANILEIMKKVRVILFLLLSTLGMAHAQTTPLGHSSGEVSTSEKRAEAMT